MKLDQLQQNVRLLATLEENRDPVISCYLDLEGGLDRALREFHEQMANLRKGLGLDERLGFEEAVDRIERYLDEDVLPGTRGLAVFARGGEIPFFDALQFQVPVPDWSAVDSVPNIYHLVELKDTYHRYIVVLCTQTSVRILEVNLGSVTADVWKERPELRRRVGREWTKQHYRNHRREKTRRMLKEAVRVLVERTGSGGYQHLILVGPPAVVGELKSNLPRYLAAMVIDHLAAAGTETPEDVVRTTLSSFIEEERQESLSAVEQLRHEITHSGLAVAGARDTLASLRAGQADMVILAREYDSPHREQIVRLAAQTGCEVETVEGSGELQRMGGVGCLLRFRFSGMTARLVA